jgi:hypothetical protein
MKSLKCYFQQGENLNSKTKRIKCFYLIKIKFQFLQVIAPKPKLKKSISQRRLRENFSEELTPRKMQVLI